MEAERAMSMSEEEEKQHQGDQGQDQEDQEQSDVKFIFKQERDDVPATPYYDDGNPQLYTEQNMQKREELKDDPIVKEAISDFIKVNFNLSSQGIVSKSDYMKVFKNACSKLRPKFDKDQIQSMVNQEYQRDNDHQPVQKIDQSHLFNSLYQLADIWCPNIDAEQIKQFFKQLKFQMKYQNQNDASAYDPLQI